MFLRFLRVPFLHRKTYSLKYWTRAVRLLVSPSVSSQSVLRQSVLSQTVSHWNLQSFSEPSRGSGLAYRSQIELTHYVNALYIYNQFFKSHRQTHILSFLVEIVFLVVFRSF